ncbi:hypothetical protein NW754_003713 [Fusarium falciforme]|uniref:Uncharacterized protein n=1 Tax=Fusarium falciforme TaxID=195108 RepID=A0A9W8V2K0_9HYPO|nr:hypothetical protein NW754_003713 [Fusarium falciforme]KAJ4192699.1 hypothetical protein NW755_003846 [Fusarium falciforme]KAJ4210516.1 hypothetical protein NW767_000789 [Fusarium falciforme]KAJ4250473.1 hypothetical protein NW757_007305 [Fusarium falciforme]
MESRSSRSSKEGLIKIHSIRNFRSWFASYISDLSQPAGFGDGDDASGEGGRRKEDAATSGKVKSAPEK